MLESEFVCLFVFVLLYTEVVFGNGVETDIWTSTHFVMSSKFQGSPKWHTQKLVDPKKTAAPSAAEMFFRVSETPSRRCLQT